MTREIKFRAWDKGDKDFVENLGDLSLTLSGELLGWLSDKGDYEIMQFTGLKDGNGKDIYEGDIVQWQKDGSDYHGQVIFDKGAFEVDGFYAPLQDEPGRAFSENYRFLVIGNIWENPNLLKGDDSK